MREVVSNQGALLGLDFKSPQWAKTIAPQGTRSAKEDNLEKKNRWKNGPSGPCKRILIGMRFSAGGVRFGALNIRPRFSEFCLHQLYLLGWRALCLLL